MPKIKNIIIFIVIAGALIFAYIFFVQPSLSGQSTDLVSQGATSNTADTSAVAGNFLTLLLNVKTIQLNTDIFSDPAFVSLHDSSIVLVPDATTGRANPFAQFGAENVAIPNTTPITPTTTSGNSSSSTLSIPALPNTAQNTTSSNH